MGWAVLATEVLTAGLVCLTAFFNAKGRDRINKANEWIAAIGIENHKKIEQVVEKVTNGNGHG